MTILLVHHLSCVFWSPVPFILTRLPKQVGFDTVQHSVCVNDRTGAISLLSRAASTTILYSERNILFTVRFNLARCINPYYAIQSQHASPLPSSQVYVPPQLGVHKLRRMNFLD